MPKLAPAAGGDPGGPPSVITTLLWCCFILYPQPKEGFRQPPNDLRSCSDCVIEVGRFAPPNKKNGIDSFPGGERPLAPPQLGLENKLSKGWVATKGPPTQQKEGLRL